MIDEQVTFTLPLSTEGTERMCDAMMEVLVSDGVLAPGAVDADVSAVCSEGRITVSWMKGPGGSR